MHAAHSDKKRTKTLVVLQVSELVGSIENAGVDAVLHQACWSSNDRSEKWNNEMSHEHKENTQRIVRERTCARAFQPEWRTMSHTHAKNQTVVGYITEFRQESVLQLTAACSNWENLKSKTSIARTSCTKSNTTVMYAQRHNFYCGRLLER